MNQSEMNIVAKIKEQHGNVIDLDKSPEAIIEIIYSYRYLIDERLDPGSGAGPGHPAPPPPPPDGGTSLVVNLLLELKREVAALHAKIR